MQILRYPLGQMEANCYFLIKDNHCLIIDPADSADFILEEIQRRKLNLQAILATHGHFDHIMAAGEIQLSLKVPFYIFKEDLFLIKRLNETAKHFLGFDPSSLPPKFIKELNGGSIIINNFAFEVIKTPGHTPGSACFNFKNENVIFTGDTLFKEGIGRHDFSYSRIDDLRHSLARLMILSEETIVYSGHGEPSTILRAHSLIFPQQRR